MSDLTIEVINDEMLGRTNDKTLHIELIKKDKEIESLQQEIKELNDSVIWWTNRFNAVEKGNRELKQEIERLNNELKLYKDNHEHLNNLLQQKDDIIKEAREYCENNKEFIDRLNDVLEILDKEKV